mgnify:CR=1 FL=1
MVSTRAVAVVASVLIVFASVASAAKRGDIRFVEVQPKICDPNVVQYAGYVTINPEEAVEYFFWFFGSRSPTAATDPVALWMTGGPGCSSELAILVENGPCTIASNLSTVSNPYSWNNIANMIYIDQPAGTGFSSGDLGGYAHNEKEVSDDMYVFLQSWFKTFPQYQANDFYITGESYGGHYVPATSHRVYEGNLNKEGIYINLKGVSVGNGLTDPSVQYQYYAQLAYNWSISLVGEPRVSLQQYDSMTAAIPKCVEMIQECQKNSAACPAAETFCNGAEFNPFFESGYNPYDIRAKCVGGGLCYNFDNEVSWLNLPSVQSALGVNKQWSICSDTVNGGFSHDWMKDYQNDIPAQLTNGTKFLIYAGDCGFICNWIGNKQWALGLEWPGKTAFNAAKDVPWMYSDSDGASKQGGIVRSANGFTFLQVFGAGHMVPMNQPAAALAFFRTLITGADFPSVA